MTRIKTCLVFALIINAVCYGQSQDNSQVMSQEPIIFLDEARISSEDMQKINPNDVAAVEVLKDSSGIKKLGDEGRNGVIYITTINHAREKYIAFFKLKSSEYANLINTLDDEKNVVYILNSKVLGKANAGDLYFIDDEKFIGLEIINETDLQREYNILDKKIGIVITAKEAKKD